MMGILSHSDDVDILGHVREHVPITNGCAEKKRSGESGTKVVYTNLSSDTSCKFYS